MSEANPMQFNCLPEGETLADLVRRDHINGFDLRFCRSDATDPDDRSTITCEPDEAEFACVYGINDLGEAIAIHDAQLTSAGADEIAACCRELFVAIVNRFAHRPDAAQRHEAEQERITATILAALRHFQRDLIREGDWIAHDILDIATSGGTLEPLTAEEIDALCESRINL
jgi:hypothetical protein